MNAVVQPIRNWFVSAAKGWDRFWFTPAQPHTLALIRILTGSMLFYTHLVWSFDLMAFLGPDSWLPNDVARELRLGENAWSYLWYVESPALLWILHIGALVVFAMLTLGLYTRVTSVVAFLITIAYCHRLHGALYGLDQINAMLVMYLMVGSCGGVYSLDRWRAKRRSGRPSLEPESRVSTNIAIRLIQLHMCVIYLFGGISKMKGTDWWDGDAAWFAVANLEYQSFDMTWLVHFPFIVSALTLTTVFWETFYCCIVWPRATRPIVLMIAVGVHGGIAAFLGMITFGLAMLFGNVAFLPPAFVRSLIERVIPRGGRAGQGGQERKHSDSLAMAAAGKSRG